MREVTREEMEKIYQREMAVSQRFNSGIESWTNKVTSKLKVISIAVGIIAGLMAVGKGIGGLIFTVIIYIVIILAIVAAGILYYGSRHLKETADLMKISGRWMRESIRSHKLFKRIQSEDRAAAVPELEEELKKNIRRVGNNSAALIYYEALFGLYFDSFNEEGMENALSEISGLPADNDRGRFIAAKAEFSYFLAKKDNADIIRITEKNADLLCKALEGDTHFACEYLSILGEYYFAKGDYKKALDYFAMHNEFTSITRSNSAEQGANTENDSMLIMLGNVDLARCYIKLGDREKALFCLNAAKPAANKHPSAEKMCEALYKEIEEMNVND